MKHSLQNRWPLPLSWRGFGSILLWVVLVCVVMLPNNTFAQNCPPGSVYPNPQITNPFKPDSSCVADTGNVKPTDSSHVKVDTCLYACEFQYATYCTPLTSGNMYTWTVVGGTIGVGTIASGLNLNCVTVLWGPKNVPASIAVTETNDSGCSASTENCVKIIESPVAVITIHPLQVCKNTWLNFLSNSSGAISYLWDFGDPGSGGHNSSTLQNPEHRYASAGSYVVTLVVGNACGCTDSATVTMTVIDQPGPKIECATTVCYGDQKCYWTPDSCVGATYNWSVTGGLILPPYTNSPRICVQWGSGNPQGTVSLAMTGCGTICSDTTTIDIPIVPSTTTITGASVVCIGDDAVYSLPAWPGNCCYDWKINSGTYNGWIIAGDSTNHIQVHWPTSGTYIVSVSWHHSTLPCGGSATMTVNVNPPFTMSGPTSPVCIGDVSTYFTSSPLGTVNAWWTVTGGTFTPPGPSSSISVTWAYPGIQTVTATTTSPSSYCNTTVTRSMTVESVSPPTSLTGPATICAGGTYTYETPPPPVGLGLLWTTTGGGNIVGSPNANPVTVTWGSSGAYSISVEYYMIDNPPGCHSSKITLPVKVFDISSISGPSDVCMDNTETYKAGPPNPDLDYQWSIVTTPGGSLSPAGSIVLGQHTNEISILWHGPGSATPVYVQVVACPSDTLTLQVTIHALPHPTVTIGGPLCPTTTLQCSPSFAQYEWKDPHGNVFGGNSSLVTVSSAGSYTLEVTNSNGCKGDTVVVVPPNVGPDATISVLGPTTYCNNPFGTINTLLSSVAGVSWKWYKTSILPVNLISTSPSYSITSSSQVDITYWLVVTDVNGCSNQSSVTINSQTCVPPSLCVSQSYTLGISYTKHGGACNLIDFTANPSSNVSSWSWTFTGGTPSSATGQTPASSVTYSKAGYYSVTLCGRVPKQGNPLDSCTVCVDTTVPIEVVPDFTTNVVCGTVTVQNTSTYLPGQTLTWGWTFTGGLPSSDLTPYGPAGGVQYTQGSSSSTHDFTLTVLNGSCSVTTPIHSVTINALPSAVIIPPPPATSCVGTDIDLPGPPNMFKYEWNFGDIPIPRISFLPHPSHAFAAPGNYTITLTVTDDQGCTGTASYPITIVAPSTCAISQTSPVVLCEGQTEPLCTTGLLCPSPPIGTTFKWYKNGGVITGATSWELTVGLPPNGAGNYSVEVTDANGCVCKTPEVTVIVNPVPIASISVEPGPLVCLGSGLNTVTMTTILGPSTYSYSWTQPPSLTVLSTLYYLVRTFSSQGTYTYAVTVTDQPDPLLHPLWSCSNTQQITIKVDKCPTAPVITATPKDTICEGDSVKLSITPPPGIINILWSTGVGTTSIVVKTSGTYSVTYTDANGCKSTSSILVKVYPLPDFSLFPISKDSCCDEVCDTAKICAPAGYSFYQWLENGLPVSPYGTGEVLAPPSSGYYQVILKDEFGCTDTSDPYCVNLGPCDTCLQPPHGLIDWWPGDDTTKDIAGYPNNGILRNGALYGKGKVLDAFSFDGIDDYVEVPNHTEVNFDTGSFSIDAWIYPRSHDGIRPIVEKRIILDTNIKAPGYRFYLEGGVLKFLMTDNSATGVYSSSASIPDTVWTHVAVTVGRTASGGTGTFYVNGIAIPGPFTPLLGNITNGTSLKIGARFTDLLGNAVSSFFGGKIDELEIFKRALSSTEVKSIYAADSLGKCKCTCVCTATAAAIQPLALTICDTVTSSVSVSPMDGSIAPPEHGSTATQGIIKMVVCDSENVILTFILPPHLICAGQTIYVTYPPNAAGWSTTNPPTDWNPFNPSVGFTMSLYPDVPVYVYLGATFIMPGSIPAGTTCTATAVVDIQQLGPERIVQLAQPLCATQISGSIEMPISVTIVPCEWCPNNLLINGDFADSLVGGTMPGGRVANWHLAYGSPDVNVSVGCEDSGSIQMWGNQVLGEAIYQQLSSGHTLIHGHMYSTTLCARWLPGYAHPYPLEFKVRASKTVLTGPQDPNGHLVGTAGPVIPLNGNWQIYGIPVWVADDDYSYITISAVNQSSAQSTDSTSIGLVDGVCIREVVPYFSNVDVAKGWNIISVPVGVEDFSKNTLFPTAISAAFGYQGYYVIKDTLENGKGYWLKFRSAQTIPISGYEINTLSVPVTAGWNMIGSLSVPIPASSIISDPPGLVTSRFFGYNDGYTIYDTLWPSKGYWIKSENIGTLILSSNFSAEVIAKSGIRITPTDELPPPAPDGSTALRPTIPKEYGLDQAYPNPFNPTTTIRYQLPVDSRVSLKVYNVLGEMVTVLADGTQPAGYDAVEWNASSVASGIYYYRLEATSVSDPGKTFTQVKKMILMK